MCLHEDFHLETTQNGDGPEYPVYICDDCGDVMAVDPREVMADINEDME